MFKYFTMFSLQFDFSVRRLILKTAFLIGVSRQIMSHIGFSLDFNTPDYVNI